MGKHDGMSSTNRGGRLIFLYGSLLPQAPGSRHALVGRSRRVAAGWIQGRLYHLGGYPGATESTDPQSQVWGEVYEMESPPESLARLDRYEGFVPESPSGCEFVRKEIRVALDDGRSADAWVYWYNLDTQALESIPGGDYLKFLQQRPR